MSIVTATDFLTALTLLSSYKAGGTVSCKKHDVLGLSLSEYRKYADSLCEGFLLAEKLLKEERIFTSRDLPYRTQLIPLSTICTVLMGGKRIHTTTVKNMVKQWYWCGVFGELYGSASETRYANDIVQVVNWINEGGDLPKTVTDFYFNPMRLLGLQSRQSAAYKDYCIGMNYSKQKRNSIVNKTPISASSSREIGGYAPSTYLGRLEKKGAVPSDDLDRYVESHWIDHNMLRADDFEKFITDRAKKLLSAIETAAGRTISGKDSDEVQQEFGTTLD